MIDKDAFETRVAALEELLREKLSVRGRDLTAKLRHAGRRVPKRVQKAGAVLTQAQVQAGHPRFRLQVDEGAVDRAFAEVTGYLREIDPAARRKDAALRLTGGLVFNLLLVVALTVLVLRWQGLI